MGTAHTLGSKRAPHLCARPPRSERRGIPGLRRQRRRRRKEEEEEEKAEEAPNPGGAAPQLRTLRPHRAMWLKGW